MPTGGPSSARLRAARLRLRAAPRVHACGQHGCLASLYGRRLECSPSGGTATPTGGPSSARLRAARLRLRAAPRVHACGRHGCLASLRAAARLLGAPVGGFSVAFVVALYKYNYIYIYLFIYLFSSTGITVGAPNKHTATIYT